MCARRGGATLGCLLGYSALKFGELTPQHGEQQRLKPWRPLQKFQAIHLPPGLTSPGREVEKTLAGALESPISDISTQATLLCPAPGLHRPHVPRGFCPVVLPGTTRDAEILRTQQPYRSQSAGGGVGSLGRLQQVRAGRQVFQPRRRLRGRGAELRRSPPPGPEFAKEPGRNARNGRWNETRAAGEGAEGVALPPSPRGGDPAGEGPGCAAGRSPGDLGQAEPRGPGAGTGPGTARGTRGSLGASAARAYSPRLWSTDFRLSSSSPHPPVALSES